MGLPGGKSKSDNQWAYVLLAIILALLLISLSNAAYAQVADEDKDQLFKEITEPMGTTNLQTCIACIWKHTKHGNPNNRKDPDKREAAAWILKTGDSYKCLYWPVNYKTVNQTTDPDATASLTWNGAIPPGMVALIHSHPKGSSRYPSPGDEEVVKRKKVPNYVVSEYGVFGAIPWIEKKDNGKLKARISNYYVYASEDVKNMSEFLNSENCPDVMPDHMLWRMTRITDNR